MANKNIIQTNIANNDLAIIACFTGEYCSTNFNYYCSEDGPNFPNNPAWANLKTDKDSEQLQSLLDDQGWDCIVAIYKDQLQTYFDQIMAKVKETFEHAFSNNGHLGDDTFYDYLPDAGFMLGQIAAHIAIQTYATANCLQTWEQLLKPMQDLVAKYDATYPNDELLADQIDYTSLIEGLTLTISAIDSTKQ